MSTPGSVTLCLRDLEEGDPSAARPLWEHFGPRLLDLARMKLRGVPQRAADEEDIAQSVFSNLCRAAQQGRLVHVGDRQELWRLLVVITARKALNRRKYEHRQKRQGTGDERSPGGGWPPPGALLDELAGLEPTPEWIALMNESCARLVELLDDPTLAQIAVWKMEGYSNAEIARRLGCVSRTVIRKLNLIRSRWLAEIAE